MEAEQRAEQRVDIGAAAAMLGLTRKQVERLIRTGALTAETSRLDRRRRLVTVNQLRELAAAEGLQLREIAESPPGTSPH